MERENGIRTDGMAGGLARRLLERSMPESTNEDDGTMPDLDSLIARNRELQQRLEAVGEERTRLSSGNQRLRRQLSELNETSRKLNEANRRERECAAREERCRRIERREAELADGEARLRRDRSRLDAERDGMEDEIGRRVAERCGLERARLEREAADVSGSDGACCSSSSWGRACSPRSCCSPSWRGSGGRFSRVFPNGFADGRNRSGALADGFRRCSWSSAERLKAGGTGRCC